MPTSDPSTGSQRNWAIVIYRLPNTPSTARVTVWKRVKELGALPLQQSVYVLPAIPRLKEALKSLTDQIEGFGGECRILEMAAIEGRQEEDLIAGFNALRDQEYQEILDECRAFDEEIDRETAAGKFYFAEAEEIDKRLDGLKVWFDTVVKRDFFDAPLRGTVEDKLRECGDRLESFSQEAYSREQSTAPEGKGRARLKDDSEGKRKAREVHSSDGLIARLKEIVTALERHSLKVGDELVETGGPALFEMKYRTRERSRTLQMEIEWPDKQTGTGD